MLIVAGIFSHHPSYCEVGGKVWRQNLSHPAFDRTILWAVYSSDSKTCGPFSCTRPIVTRPATRCKTSCQNYIPIRFVYSTIKSQRHLKVLINLQYSLTLSDIWHLNPYILPNLDSLLRHNTFLISLNTKFQTNPRACHFGYTYHKWALLKTFWPLFCMVLFMAYCFVVSIRLTNTT